MTASRFAALRRLVAAPLHAYYDLRRTQEDMTRLRSEVNALSAFLESELNDLRLTIGAAGLPSPVGPTLQEAPAVACGQLSSVVCRQEHFRSDWYVRWANELVPARDTGDAIPSSVTYHRKDWEWAAIAHALNQYEKLRPGQTGIGFAVGREPLPALFAKYGVTVHATDLHAHDEHASGWRSTSQHASSRDSLFYGSIVSRSDFESRVSFHEANMNDLTPFKKESYDFVWSSCAMEHLGSLEHGQAFVLNSCELLKPGGVAVHTTEFNVSSGIRTVERGNNVIYRRSDLEQLKTRLNGRGFVVAPFDLLPGSDENDMLYDTPPYYSRSGVQHIKLLQSGYVTTSMRLVIERRQ